MSHKKKSTEKSLWGQIMECPWLTSGQQSVLLAIAYCSNWADGSNSHASLTTLMSLTKFSRKHVVQLLKELTELGFIKTTGTVEGGTTPIRAIQKEALKTPPLLPEKKAKKGHDTTGIPSIPTLARDLKKENPLLTTTEAYSRASALRQQLLEAEKGVPV